MCCVENGKKIATIQQFTPVLLPIVLVISMTSALRIGTVIQSGTTNKSGKTVLTTNKFNSTEDTFLQYAKVFEALNAKNDTVALAQLHALQNAPISADGNTFRDDKLKTFSPQGMMIVLGNMMLRRAGQLNRAGDDATAHAYIKALYEVGDNLLASNTPTIGGLELAHHFHGLASRAEVRLYPQDSFMNVVTASYQYNALRAMWNRQILPQINLQPKEMPSYDKERLVATRLVQEYRDGWSRIRAGES